MVGIITLLITLVFSLLVTRIGAVALTLTGMSQDAARFQARSAYTGVGFTTLESEQVVNHPVRRKIAGILMISGNIGIAVVIASMMATFAAGSDGGYWHFAVLFIGLAALWIITTQKWFDETIEAAISWSLRKWTTLDVRDYVSLLHLADGYVVLEIVVNDGDWVGEKPLAESQLALEGVLVLGIHRANGNYVGSPNGNTKISVGDNLTVYGPIERLEELDLRKKGYFGDRAHQIACETQEEAKKKQEDEPAAETS